MKINKKNLKLILKEPTIFMFFLCVGTCGFIIYLSFYNPTNVKIIFALVPLIIITLKVGYILIYNIFEIIRSEDKNNKVRHIKR